MEVCTGPLGQGICNAVGLAIAERHMAATFNTDSHKVFDNFTYVICGDGCLQEGVSGEASSLAGHLGLGKLIVLYDDNSITIDGETHLSFTEDVAKRYEAYGWHVQTVDDVSKDLDALRAAIKAFYVSFAQHPESLSQAVPLIYHRLSRLAAESSSMESSSLPVTREYARVSDSYVSSQSNIQLV